MILPFVSGDNTLKTGQSILIDTLLSCYHRVHTTEAYRPLIMNEAKLRGGCGIHNLEQLVWSWAGVAVRFSLQEATVAKHPITRVTGDCLLWSLEGLLRLWLSCSQAMWFQPESRSVPPSAVGLSPVAYNGWAHMAERGWTEPMESGRSCVWYWSYR